LALPPPGREEAQHWTGSVILSLDLILADRYPLSRVDANPSEIFAPACLFDSEQRGEGPVEILSAGGEDPVTVNDDTRMVLQGRGHGPAEAVGTRPDLARNDRDSAH
jgi:hypothetical protein